MIGLPHNLPYCRTIAYTVCDQDTYQQDVFIHRTVGENYEEILDGLKIWHIFVEDGCRDDYGDVRFADDSGVELSHYLWPDYDSESGHFWVQLCNTTQPGRLHICYGDSSLEFSNVNSANFGVFTECGLHQYAVLDGVTTVQVLVVAGGGGGGTAGSNCGASGGGGAGGVIYSRGYSVTPHQSIDIIVGDGGNANSNGENSKFGNLIAIGGGSGGRRVSDSSGTAGGNGGSGGGGASHYWGSYAGGSGTVGQGYAGGRGRAFGNGRYAAGGGGGAGGNGTDGVTNGGNGGPGIKCCISGVETYYGGGGGGALYREYGVAGTPGIGGIGGGGSAEQGGISNTGGGGGGSIGVGKPGGSGIVIVRVYSANPPSVIAFYNEYTPIRRGQRRRQPSFGSTSMMVI